MKVRTMAARNFGNKEGEDDEKCDENDDSGSDKYFSSRVMKKMMMAVRAKRLNMNRMRMSWNNPCSISKMNV